MGKQKGERIERLKVGRDYVNLHDNDVVVIDRVSDIMNRGFERLKYKNYLSCSDTSNWREATEEEVIEAFKKHLAIRYGEDWETMKIKEKHPASLAKINDGSWGVKISKNYDGWIVWNKNGLLYCNGIWVERLEEKDGEVNVDELKMRALLEGLEAENIEEFMREAKVVDYRNYGKAYVSAARNKINEQKTLFITDDSIKVFSKEALIYIVNKTFYKKETELCNIYDKSNREDFKYFFHESNAYEYIWKNKRVFSYEEIAKRASQTELYYLETLAMERSEG